MNCKSCGKPFDGHYGIQSVCAENQRLREAISNLEKIEEAARVFWKAKGRHHTQIATCDLGELLGYHVIRPTTKLSPVNLGAEGKDHA